MTKDGKREVSLNANNKQIVISAQNAPVALGNRMLQTRFDIHRGKKEGSIIIRGTDYIGQVVTGTTATAGTAIRNDYISPTSATFDGSRIKAFGYLYEKYLFRRMRYIYVPSVSTSTAGCIILAFDKDFADLTPTGGDVAIRTLMSLQNANMFQVWEKQDLNVKLTDLQDFYYTNDSGYDGRLVYTGQLYVVCGSDLLTSTRYGSVYIEYEVELFDPQLDQLNDYSALNSSSNTVSLINGGAWNSLSPVVLSQGIKTVKDLAGNLGINLPPGVWMLEQFANSASLAGNYTAPNIPVNALGFVTTVQNIISGSPSTGQSYRLDKLTVPTGGANIFGTVSTATSYGGNIIRVMNSDKTFIV